MRQFISLSATIAISLFRFHLSLSYFLPINIKSVNPADLKNKSDKIINDTNGPQDAPTQNKCEYYGMRNISMPTFKHAKLKANIKQHPRIEYYTNPSASNPNFAPVLSVRFQPPVTKGQFLCLMQLYSSSWSPRSRSQVRYDDKVGMEEGYDILDFLPPILQATWGHLFRPEDEKGDAPLFYQCYGFVLDVLSVGSYRNRSRWKAMTGSILFRVQDCAFNRINFLFHWLELGRKWMTIKTARVRQFILRFIKMIKPSSSIVSLFASNAPRSTVGSKFLSTSHAITTGTKLTLSTPDSRSVYEAIQSKTKLISKGFNSTNSYAENDGIKPGDIIIVYHDNSGNFQMNQVWLDHVVIYIDEGLLFEKSGSGEGTPFRLIDYATFEKSWAPVPGLFRMEVRRNNPWGWSNGDNNDFSAIDVVDDLSLGGRFSLEEVRNFAKLKEKKDPVLCGHDATSSSSSTLSLPTNIDIPGRSTELCGSYDEESGRILFTTIVKMKELLEMDTRNKRFRLPERAFKPFLPFKEDALK